MLSSDCRAGGDDLTYGPPTRTALRRLRSGSHGDLPARSEHPGMASRLSTEAARHQDHGLGRPGFRS